MPQTQTISAPLATTRIRLFLSSGTFLSIRKSLSFFSPSIPNGRKRSPSFHERSVSSPVIFDASTNSMVEIVPG
jgi:hypothetical protein